MPKPISATTAEEAARLYKALADPVRLLSLVRFAEAGEACFEELADAFDVPPSSLAHHLKILVAAGILSGGRRGTWSWYQVRHLALQVACELLRIGGPLRGWLEHQPSASQPRAHRPDSAGLPWA